MTFRYAQNAVFPTQKSFSANHVVMRRHSFLCIKNSPALLFMSRSYPFCLFCETLANIFFKLSPFHDSTPNARNEAKTSHGESIFSKKRRLYGVKNRSHATGHGFYKRALGQSATLCSIGMHKLSRPFFMLCCLRGELHTEVVKALTDALNGATARA